MPEIDVDALRVVAEGATPGPWEVDRFFWKIGSTRGMPDEFWVSVEAAGSVIACMPEEAPASEPNAAHIAEFDPPTVLALLDRLQAAEGAVERVRALAATWDGDGVGGDRYCAAEAWEALGGHESLASGPESDASDGVALGEAGDLGGPQMGREWLRRHYGDCPKCGFHKFIGHGPLCTDCYLAGDS